MSRSTRAGAGAGATGAHVTVWADSNLEFSQTGAYLATFSASSG